MSGFRLNISALNAICVRLGGTGGHRRNLAALNEWASLAGGMAAHDSSVGVLNEVAVLLGGAGGHTLNVDALNEIAVLTGGVGGHRMHVDALSEIVARIGGTPAAPGNVSPPTVGGTPVVGATLSAADGTWSGAPSLAGAWQRNGVDIPGATGTTRVLVAADDGTAVRRRVTATNAQGAATAFSAAVAVTYPAPTAAGALPDRTFTAGSGVMTCDAAGDFTNAVGGAWSLPGAPAGVSVDAAGVVLVDTGATGALADRTITVRYANSGGVAESAFGLTVAAAPAFPQVVGAAFAETNSNAAAHPITMPAGVLPGELLLAFVAIDGNSTTVAINTGVSGGNWTLSQAGTVGAVAGVAAWKVAQGGDALTLTTSTNERNSHRVYRIAGAASVVQVANTGSHAIPLGAGDPPGLAPAPGAARYLWFVAMMADGQEVAAAAPGGYSYLETTQHSETGGASTSIARRELEAASQDPGPFATPAGKPWVAFTVAVA
jgi:hypothetical protein